MAISTPGKSWIRRVFLSPKKFLISMWFYETHKHNWNTIHYLVIGNVGIDWEMRVDETHLVFESNRYSLDHVFNVGCSGTDASNMFTVSVPYFDAQLIN